MSKDMIVYKESIFSKIKNFIKSIFNKKVHNNQNQNTMVVNTDKFEKKSFVDEIIIKKESEEIELEKLQEDFKEGNIFQEDITENKRVKLIELYKKQNEELKKSNKTRKEKILEYRRRLQAEN